MSSYSPYPRITEWTVTALIAEYLGNLGISVLCHVMVNITPKGWVRPDIQLKLENVGTLFGEVKPEYNEYEGLYMAKRYLISPIAKGSFLIAYDVYLESDISPMKLVSDNYKTINYKRILSKYEYKVTFFREAIPPDTDTVLRAIRNNDTDTLEYKPSATHTDTLKLDEVPSWLEEKYLEDS